MHPEASDFVARFGTEDQISVIEIGSRNINGTARVHFPNAIWTGLDIVDGSMVDVVCDAESHYPDEQVDMVICCEVFEHTPRWRQIIRHAARWLKPGGKMVITCAGPGREPHSAFDGRHELIGDEHYQNISVEELACEMCSAGLTVLVSDHTEVDTYAAGSAGPSAISRFNNVLPDHVRLAASASFPSQDWEWWYRYDNGKLATTDRLRVPYPCELALAKLSLSVDPPPGSFWDMELYGAGLHLMPAGTSLAGHFDASFHPQKPWRRTSSLVYFLDTSKGGGLRVGNSCTIFPEENTAVMLSPDQWHEVLQAESDRRTLCLFSWTIDTGNKVRTHAEFGKQ